MITLHKSTYGGMDWHDSKMTIDYIKPSDEEYGYETTDDVYKALINDIVKEHPYAEDMIRNAFATNKPVTFPTKCPKYNEAGDIIDYELFGKVTHDGKHTYYESSVKINPEQLTCYMELLYGQFTYSTTYYITELKTPVYAVIENFLSVTKGVPSIERMYHRPFDSYAEAKAYMDKFIPHENYSTQVYIACFDVDTVKKEWYDLQIKIIEILENSENSNLLYDSDTFSPYAKYHYDNLTK